MASISRFICDSTRMILKSDFTLTTLLRQQVLAAHQTFDLSSIPSPFTIQKRNVHVKRRHRHPYLTWTRKRRERNDQELTKDNKEFINQFILDTKGPITTPETGMPYISPLKEIIRPRTEWTPKSIRTGLIAKKLGVVPIWDKFGKRYLTTMLQVVDNHVIKYVGPDTIKQEYDEFRTRKMRDLGFLIVGAESADPQNFTKEYLGLFHDSGLHPKLKINRFTVTADGYLPPGTPLYASHFQVGQYVDVRGRTIERGFQGVMVRWGFKGMPATHGVTKSHRRGGNTGGGGEKGRCWPGTKMPGNMGGAFRIMFAQQIVRINTKYNVIYVRGPSIPGDTGAYVTIRDTFIPTRWIKNPPFPTYYPDEAPESLPEEICHEKYHNFADPSILFTDQKP